MDRATTRSVIDKKDIFKLKIGVDDSSFEKYVKTIIFGLLIAVIAALVSSKVFVLSGIPLLVAILCGGPVFAVIPVIIATLAAAGGAITIAYFSQKFKKEFENYNKVKKSLSSPIDEAGKYCAQFIFHPQIIILMQSGMVKQAIYEKLKDNFRDWGYYSNYAQEFVFEVCDENEKNLNDFAKVVLTNYKLSFDTKKSEWIKSLWIKSCKLDKAEVVKSGELLTTTFAQNIKNDLLDIYDTIQKPSAKQAKFCKDVITVLDKRIQK